jgi:GNAT superfamily N-acetyltransferase
MLQIRPATSDDLPAILPMVAQTCAFHQHLAPAKYPFLPEPEKRYGWWLGRQVSDPRSVFLVAELDGRVVGFLIAAVEAEIPIYRLKEFGFVHDLWVEEDARRHGVGKALMLEMVKRFRTMGVEQIRLDVVAGNEPAERLFAACGFAVATKQMIACLPRQDSE